MNKRYLDRKGFLLNLVLEIEGGGERGDGRGNDEKVFLIVMDRMGLFYMISWFD